MADTTIKRFFIKDPVWGHIELFRWERSILNSYLFNRLHNVLQNSYAYQVYPGLQYSRFLHSVGAMHVATEIFTNIVVNSSSPDLDHLLSEAKSVREHFGPDDEPDLIIQDITRIIPCQPDFALLLGTVRVAALLHDVGHLPYSHIFEFALEKFLRYDFDELHTLFESTPSRTSDTHSRNLHNRLREVFLPNHGDSFRQPHEALGERLMHLLSQFPDMAVAKPFIDGAAQLWHNDSLPVSRSILSGDIDADRIDFVRRDGYFSGLYTTSIDFGRLFSFYELATTTENADEAEIPRARPSERATAESEKLLWERFLDYKYIVAHHKVHLFDEILERLILYALVSGLMNDLLGAIDTVFQPRIETLRGREQILHAEETILTQFNDSWVDAQLYSLYKSSDDEVVLLLQALSEKRNLFISLLKRDADYELRFPKLFELQGRLATFETYDPVTLALYIAENKRSWEQELSHDGGDVLVIIGDLSRKLKIGIKSKNAAQFFGLQHLREFLWDKYTLSRPFNIWYYCVRESDRLGVFNSIAEFIQDRMSEDMDIMIRRYEESHND